MRKLIFAVFHLSHLRFAACLVLFCFFIARGINFHEAPSARASAAGSPRERVSLNAGWRFQKGDPKEAEGQLEYQKIKDWINATGNEFVLNPGAPKRNRPEGNLGREVVYTQRNFDDRGWRQLNLPHDWGIEGPFNQQLPGETGKLPWWGVGWYRKHLTISANEKGKQFYLDIDGAMAYAAVWLNGEFIGGWPYGYSSFRLDLTPHIAFGADNVLAVRLDNPPDSSRWYPGGGIYRNVWLVKTAPIHVGHWGTYLTTPEVTPSYATVNLKVTLENHHTTAATVNLRAQIYELLPDGRKRSNAVAASDSIKTSTNAGAKETATLSLRLNKPKLWNLKKPALYVAVIGIEQNGSP